MDVRVPKLAEGVEAGAVISIFVKEGDKVTSGEDLLELETDKATASVPSPGDGIVSKIHVSVGDNVKVGQVAISIDGVGGESAADAPAETTAVAAPQALPPVAQTAAAAPVAPLAMAAPVAVVSDADVAEGLKLPASPTVKRIAQLLAIDLRQVAGSGKGGRIGVDDLKNYIATLRQLAATPQSGTSSASVKAPMVLPDFSQFGSIRREKMSNLRKKISEKMTQSWTTVPHVTQYDEADITELGKLAKKYAPVYEKAGVRLTLTVLILKAIVDVLKKYPIFNATIDEANEEIIFKDYINLGIAVDTEKGLIVPVIRDVDQKSVKELASSLKELADKTRARKVGMDDLQGGSFTISNQGGIGGGAFTPIVNTPELAILGMARAVDKPVVRNGKIVIGKALPLSVSYDHRAIDGGSAARFITDLVSAIENFDESELKLSVSASKAKSASVKKAVTKKTAAKKVSKKKTTGRKKK